MLVWVVAGEYPDARHPARGNFVADQVTALRAEGHEVRVITSVAPSLRPAAQAVRPHAEAVLDKVPAVRRLPGLSAVIGGRAQGEARPRGALEAGGDDLGLPELPGEAVELPDPDPKGPRSRSQRAAALAGYTARGLVGASRVLHDATGNTVAMARMVGQMRELAAREGLPTVIHAHNVYPAGIAAAQFGPAYGVPVVVTEHMTAYLRGQYSAVELASAIRVLDRAAAVIAVSKAQAEALPIPTDRIQVVPNVVAVDAFRLRAPEAAESGCVLAVGKLTPHKRLDMVLRAYAQLPADVRRRHPLRVVGDGPERGDLAQLATSLGLAPSVLVGPLDRAAIVSEFASAAVVVSASEVETFGVTLIEALAAGVPFVATDSGGPRDIVGPGLGELVGRDDEAALGGALARALALPADAEADRRRREEAVARFGPRAVAERLTQIYAGLRG